MLAAAAAWQLVAVVILAAIVAPLIKVGRPGMARRRSAAATTDWRAVRREAQAAAQLRRSTAGTLGALPTLTPKATSPAPVVEPTSNATEPGAEPGATEPVEVALLAVPTVETIDDDTAATVLPPLARPGEVEPAAVPGPVAWPAPQAPWQPPAATAWPAPAGPGWPSPRRRRRLGRWAPPVASTRHAAVLTPESAPAAWDLRRHPRTVW